MDKRIKITKKGTEVKSFRAIGGKHKLALVPKTKKFEMETAECGHTVPMQFVVHDKEGLGTCMPCLFEEMALKIQEQNRKIKKLKKVKQMLISQAVSKL